MFMNRLWTSSRRVAWFFTSWDTHSSSSVRSTTQQSSCSLSSCSIASSCFKWKWLLLGSLGCYFGSLDCYLISFDTAWLLWLLLDLPLILLGSFHSHLTSLWHCLAPFTVTWPPFDTAWLLSQLLDVSLILLGSFCCNLAHLLVMLLLQWLTPQWSHALIGAPYILNGRSRVYMTSSMSIISIFQIYTSQASIWI